MTYGDLIIEKQYLAPESDWFEVIDIEEELRLLELHFKDPGLLFYVGSQFRTSYSRYRVSDRKRRQQLAALPA